MARSLLFVHPHPDDESIACGGTIARHVAAGDRVTIVTCTDGAVGENQAGIDLGGRAMVDVRHDEMADAAAALGVDDHVWLGYRDSGMDGTDDNDHPGSFHTADLDAAALRLATIIRDRRPLAVVSDDANGTYGHPDHVKANRVTIRAVELAGDPLAPLGGRCWAVPKRYVHAVPRSAVWTMHQRLTEAGLASPFGGPDQDGSDEDDDGTGPIEGPQDLPFGVEDGLVTTAVDVGVHRATREAAMRAHRSQIGQDSFFFNLPDDLADEMFAHEHYVLEEGHAAPADDGLEHDLLAGVARPRSTQPLGQEVVDVEAFKATVGRFATGVTVMAAAVDGIPHGMTANAVASVSLDPLLVLVCVEDDAHMVRVVDESGAFALSILAEDQLDVSDHFADPMRPLGAAGFLPFATADAVTGSPVLHGAVGWLDCQVRSTHRSGDHVIVVGHVLAVDVDEAARPLLWFGSGYASLGQLPPAAAAS